ncbi:hypothetical protein ACLOJK_029268 [Asimina triloba]
MEVSVGIFLWLCTFPVPVLGKECTNIPTQLSSHSLRYDLLSSSNQSWRDEMFSYYHLIPTDDSAWLKLLPRKILSENTAGEELDWARLYRRIKDAAVLETGGGGSGFLKEVSLHDVRLEAESMHGHAQQTNLEYLLMLDEDNLVWSFRKTANLDTPGKPYGGWEGPTVELRGHFVGHYLSASAKMWASTHNDSLQNKMSSVVSALHECQKAIGTGYLSAFTDEQFDRFEAIKPVWAPYYTVHKIMAGLLDQYLFAGNNVSLEMVVGMAGYFSKRVQNVIAKHTLERHWLSLNEETGGMNDILYKLYTVTGDQKHLVLAHLFDKPCFLGLLAVQADSLSGFHANTHIPVVIGSQMRYEVTGDPLYEAIGTYFMEIVNSSHSYATGGTSVSEFCVLDRSNPKRLADTLQMENEESCTTYNMLKVSRNLFRWTKEVAYADYYERALTNGVLSIQRGREPGIMIYMLPQGRGVSKARSYHGWGTKYDSFWCCYGTGIESFSKLGDSIYFEEDGATPGLYIIQIPCKFDPLRFAKEPGMGTQSNIYLRIPSWTHLAGAVAKLNDEILDMQLPDDRPEYASVQAILYGPYLLAGLTDGDWDIRTGAAKSLSDWISPIPSAYNSQLLSLTQEVGTTSFIFSSSNNSITMEKQPGFGTDSAVHATFRLVPADTDSSHFSSLMDLIGKYVALEPFDIPGMAVMHQGPNNNLIVAPASDNKGSSVFQFVSGLDGKANTVSFEAKNKKGCFLYSGEDYTAGENVKLKCQLGRRMTSNAEFSHSVSFSLNEGMNEYHPIREMKKLGSATDLNSPFKFMRQMGEDGGREKGK